MLRRSSFVAGVMMVLMVSTASAQQRGARGRGLGFGGPGMRGPGSGRAGMWLAMLLRIPDVRKDLGTTEDQDTKIDSILNEMRASRPDTQGLQDLSENERSERQAEIRKKTDAMNRKAEAAITDVLDKKQLGRLNQLQLQLEGAKAMLRPDIAKRLDLTEEQETTMQEIRRNAAAEDAAAFENFPQVTDAERQEISKKAQERQKKTEADLFAVLTEEQKAKWAEIQGERFDFPRR